jgi:hypothetical protein
MNDKVFLNSVVVIQSDTDPNWVQPVFENGLMLVCCKADLICMVWFGVGPVLGLASQSGAHGRH